MAALTVGTKAPEFELTTLDGKRFVLSNALSRGPVVLAFFKVSCPVCQFAFPYLERLYKAYRQQGYTLVGISQNDAKESSAFNKEFGVTFPVLLDELSRYPVSNAYGLTNVPTLFLIQPDGTIAASFTGFDKQGLEGISASFAAHVGKPISPVFQPGESVPDHKPG